MAPVFSKELCRHCKHGFILMIPDIFRYTFIIPYILLLQLQLKPAYIHLHAIKCSSKYKGVCNVTHTRDLVLGVRYSAIPGLECNNHTVR